MKYPKEVVEAAAVVIAHLNAPMGLAGLAGVNMPPDLVEEVERLVKSGRPTPADLMGLWNELRDKRLRECTKLTAARRRVATARLREYPEREDWEGFMRCINRNPWCTGERPSPAWPNWKANFDWFIRPGNITKYMEGGFESREEKPMTARDRYAAELERRNTISKGE